MTEEGGPSQPWTARWDEEVAQRWIAVEEAMDRALGPFGEAALARAEPRPGEHMIDVGCGCGATTIALADVAGRAGRVLGVDIAAPMLARASQRVANRRQVELVEADAATFPFDVDHDLVFSRFGVMFFRDPEAAFRNLARSLRHGGRMAFVCWRRFEENPWLNAAFATLRELVPDAAPPPVDGPGPCALADPDRTTRLLGAAGFEQISLHPIDLPVCLGPDVPSAVQLATNTGPVGRALPAADEGTRAAVRGRLGALFSRHLGPEGVFLPGAAWVVVARR
jgi:SAM-dependent methyltransferase